MKTLSILVVGLGFAVAAACSSSDGDAPSNPGGDGGLPPSTGGRGSGGGSPSGNDDGGAPPPRIIRVEEVRAAVLPLARAACDWTFGCCTDDERAFRLGAASDAEDCAERALDAAMNDQSWAFEFPQGIQAVLRQVVRLQQGLDYARVRIDEDALAACAEQEKERECASAPAPVDGHCVARSVPDPAEDPCAKVLVGTQSEGETCATETDCEPGLRCSAFVGGDGACVAELKEGDNCANDCPAPLVCDYRAGTCVTGAGDGDSCAFADDENRVRGTETVQCRPDLVCDTVTLKCTDSQCASGAYCNNDDARCPEGARCVNGTCGAPLPAGATCNQNDDCEDGTCRYVPARGRQICTTPAANGAECEQDDDCQSAFCKFGNDSAACAVRAAVGRPCVGAEECESYRCQFDAQAGGNACAAPAPLGATCAGDFQCNPPKKILCVDSKCAQTPIANGSACSRDQQCKSGACAKGVCRPLGTDGSPCGTEEPPCDDAFYCDIDADEPACAAKKRYAEPCTRHDQCSGGNCSVTNGQQRCRDIGPGEAACSGGREQDGG